VRKTLIFVLLLGTLFSLPACAVRGGVVVEDRSMRGAILERIQDQQQRINQGVRSGELTRREADVLQDNLDWIRRRFNQMKADGLLTPREIERLDEMLDRNSAMIYNKKHNPARRLY
jgi:methyl-accepting chemotaxis protein